MCQDKARVQRVWTLDDQTLCKFTMIVEAQSGLYYHDIEWVERVNGEIILHGLSRLIVQSETYLGIVIYDDENMFVAAGTFPQPRTAVSGDVFHPSQRFSQ